MANLNNIEVSVRDTTKAFEILRDRNISFSQDHSNEFILEDEDEWNEAMEIFEENNIEIY